MRRRIALVLLLTIGFTSLGSAAVAVVDGVGAGGSPDGEYWACVGSETIDFGYCVKNPLRLVPQTPRVI